MKGKQLLKPLSEALTLDPLMLTGYLVERKHFSLPLRVVLKRAAMAEAAPILRYE